MVFPYFSVFHVNILCLCYLCVLSSIFLFVYIYLEFCIRIYIQANLLLQVTFLRNGIRAMEDSFGGMFKLTGSNYSVWKVEDERHTRVQRPLVVGAVLR